MSEVQDAQLKHPEPLRDIYSKLERLHHCMATNAFQLPNSHERISKLKLLPATAALLCTITHVVFY